MTRINWACGDHKIDFTPTSEQLYLIQKYEEPLKQKLAEEQVARYYSDPEKYRVLHSVVSLMDENVCQPYLGAIGGSSTYIFYGDCVQYKYLDNAAIWLTEPPSLAVDGIYRVTPTGLGYIVKYEVDLTDYDSW